MRKQVLLWLVGIVVLAACAVPLPEENSRVVLLWYDLRGRREAALLHLTETFNKSGSGVRLIAEYQSDLAARLAQAPADHRPDLVLVGMTGDPNGINAWPVLSPEEIEGLASETWVPMAAALFRDAGGRWKALPLGLRTYALYFNADRLRDAGIDPDTLDDVTALEEALCTLSDEQEGRVGMAFPAQAGPFLAWWQSGTETETLTLLAELFQRDCARLYPHPAEAVQAMAEGEAATFFGSTSDWLVLQSAMSGESSFEVGVMLPKEASRPATTTWEGSGIVIVHGGVASEWARSTVVTWLAGEEAGHLWSSFSGELPPRISLLRAAAQATPGEEPWRTFCELALSAADSPSTVRTAAALSGDERRIALVEALRALSDGEPIEQVIGRLSPEGP